MSFSSLGISDHLIKGLEKQKYFKPYPIQEQTIPAILNNKDVLGIAQTGSGKTASYVLPILMNLEGKTATKIFTFCKACICGLMDAPPKTANDFT